LTPPVIDSRASFVAALRWGFEQAIADGSRRIVCVDPDFREWPYEEGGLQSVLTPWLKQPGRRLVLLAHRYDDLPRRQPRFVAWRRLWAHAIEAWSPQEGDAVELPTLLFDDQRVAVRLIDSVHWRGRAEIDARAVRSWGERIDAVLQRSEPSFAANALGL
jgi:hypothetical protein